MTCFLKCYYRLVRTENGTIGSQGAGSRMVTRASRFSPKRKGRIMASRLSVKAAAKAATAHSRTAVRQGLPIEVGHEDPVHGAGLEQDRRPDVEGAGDHEHQAPEACHGLGRVFRLEVREGGAEADAHGDDSRHDEKNGDGRKRHHEAGHLEQEVGGDDQHFGQHQQRQVVDEKLDAQERAQGDRRGLDQPEGLAFQAHGRVGEAGRHGRRRESASAMFRKENRFCR